MEKKKNNSCFTRKIGALLTAAVLILSAFNRLVIYSAAQENEKGDSSVIDNTATFLYLATDGSDDNPGTKEAPFATLQAAVEASRYYEGTVVINVRGGWYRIEETIRLTEQDTDLVIRGMPGEDAVFAGGIEVPLSDMNYVTDEAILNRIVDTEARKHIRHVNLGQYGLETFGSMKLNGFGVNSSEKGYAAQLTYRGEYLVIAQYPNGEGYGNIDNDASDAYLRANAILTPESGVLESIHGVSVIAFTLQEFDRHQFWTQAEDIWVQGYFSTRWADAIMPAKIMEDGAVYTYNGSYAPNQSGLEVKILHLLEELDMPGEYYVDYTTGDLYVYAPEGMGEEEVFEYVMFDQSFVSAQGAKNITFENLRICGTHADMFYAEYCDGIVINYCEISNTGKWVLNARYCMNSGIQNSCLHDLGGGGAYFDYCGDRENLISGNSFFINNEVARFSRYNRVDSPAMKSYSSIGILVAHNKIYETTHNAFAWDNGNDITLEYNEISEACTYTWDAGAVYSIGRNYSSWGNTVRYNYIHDMPRNVTAVYWDDLCSGTQTYGNVFYNLGTVLACNGGRNNEFFENLIIECDGYHGVLSYSDRGNYGHTRGALEKAPFAWESELWMKKYPALKEIVSEIRELKTDDMPDDISVLEIATQSIWSNSDDPIGRPKNAVISNNLWYNTPDFTLEGTAYLYCKEYEGNTHLDYEGVSFEAFCNGDYSIVSSIIKEIDTDEWEKIGLEEYAYEDFWKEKEGVELKTLAEMQR